MHLNKNSLSSKITIIICEYKCYTYDLTPFASGLKTFGTTVNALCHAVLLLVADKPKHSAPLRLKI